MKVIVCGSRNWGKSNPADRIFERLVLDGLLCRCNERAETLHIIEGGNPNGADQIAAEWAQERIDRKESIGHNGEWVEGTIPYAFKSQVEHEQFTADWKRFGKGAGHERNQRMFDQTDPSIVIGFKAWDELDESFERGGTEDMCSIAKAAGKPTYLLSRL